MKKRIRRGGEFWLASIAQQRQSGVTIAAWCQQHQLAQSTFCKWKQKLSGELSGKPSASHGAKRGSSNASSVSSLIELTPVVAPPPRPVQQPSMIEISLTNGTLLRFRGNVDVGTLRQLIAMSDNDRPRDAGVQS